jgi:acyl dehydratase
MEGMNRRYFENLAVGQKFGSPSLAVDAAAIMQFAAEFDPRPFHLDDAAARQSIFAGLAASGWDTAGLTMRLCLASDFRPMDGSLGIGGELTWLKPERPGDEPRVEIEVLGAARRARGRGMGWSRSALRHPTSTMLRADVLADAVRRAPA